MEIKFSFLLTGAVGVVWFIIWMMFTYDKPANHPRISLKERDYILSSIGSAQDKKTRVWQFWIVLLSFIVFKTVCLWACVHVEQIWIELISNGWVWEGACKAGGAKSYKLHM